MYLQIALVLSVVIQFVTAIIALSLVRKINHNTAWWLISISLSLMALRRLFEIFQIWGIDGGLYDPMTNSWVGIIISILMLISLSFIKRLFNVQARIDKLKQRNQEQLLSATIEAEERERMRFSKELHDGLGPLLSSAKMGISAIKKNPQHVNLEIVNNTETLVNDAITAIKEISNNLSPHVLNNFGLYDAIRSFIKKIMSVNAIDIQFSSNIENQKIPHNIEVILYRITTELVNNTLKHAAATRITIEIMIEGEELKYEYYDNGKGFDWESKTWETKGIGVQNILSRIKSLKGNYNIITAEENGFEIHINLNLKSE